MRNLGSIVFGFVMVSGCLANEVTTSSKTSAISSENALTTNSLAQNGVWSNSLAQNGVWSNGVWSNGVWSNGVWSNSLSSNGVWSNGVWSNGVWSNGVWSNGVWSNGVWSNGAWQGNLAARYLLDNNPQTGKLLQYIYECAMPGDAPVKELDKDDGTKLVLRGGIGLAPTWDTEGGSCDESCQRWVSACVLARTNAYGVKVSISLRAPDNAPAAIKHALQVAYPDELTQFPLREGAFYGNIFATTPPPQGTDGPLMNTPTFYACAGPGSNIPEVTKRFVSSQGNGGPIQVPGRCVQLCDMPADEDHGAMASCATSLSGETRYPEVITVYVHDLIEVCGNLVCEAKESATASCPSDCQPDSWAHTFAGTNIVSATTRQEPNYPGGRRTSIVAPDNTIVSAGVARQSTEIDLGGPLEGIVGPDDHYIVLVKYAMDGTFLWGKRIKLDASHGPLTMAELGGVAVGADGSIAVSAMGWNTIGARVIVTKLTAAGGLEWQKSSVSSDNGPGVLQKAAHNTEDVIAVDVDGNVVVGGTYALSLWFEGDPVHGLAETGAQCRNGVDDDGDGYVDDGCMVALPSANVQGSAFFFKLHANAGAPVWATAFARPSDQASAVTTDVHGDVVVAFRDTGLSSRGLMKLSGADGTVVWQRKGRHESVVTDADGNVYATGSYQPFVASYEFSFGPSNPSFFVAKYAAADGALIAVKTVNTICLAKDFGDCSSNSIGFDIALDPGGNVVVGATGGTTVSGPALDFGAGPFVSWGTADVYLLSYASDLTFRWAKHVPMVLDGIERGVSVDGAGHLIMSGTYAGSTVVDGRLLVSDVPEDPTNGNSFLSSITVPASTDHEAPIIGHVPESFQLQATGPDGARAWYMLPTAIDNGNAGVTIACSPVPDSMFALGATDVKCVVRDPLNNTPPLPSTFTVTVVDTLGPVFAGMPTSVTGDAAERGGAHVDYTKPVATDQVDGDRAVTCTPASGSLFAVGSTIVQCSASDTRGNASTTRFTVVVTDTTPPVITAPSGPITAHARIATYDVTAEDVVDGTVPVTCTPASGSSFPVGTTTVSCIADDAAGNRATASFDVYVPADSTPPVLHVPGPLTIEAADAAGSVVTYDATGIDDIDGAVPTICVLPSGSPFAIGTTIVMCQASDSAGNVAVATFPVNVVDTSAPAVTVADVTVEATSASGAAASFSATAIDRVDGAVAASCSAASGSVFPLGPTTVTCSATDAHGNVGTASFTVTVVDTTAPTLTVPGTVSAIATSANGAAVAFTTSASDNIDGTLTPMCSHASGATFAPGTTTVTCTATDSHGNHTSKTFTVRVTFSWSGVQQPVNPDGSSIFKLGRTVPVTFQLTGASAGITNLVATLTLVKVSNAVTGTEVEATSTSAADTGNAFRYTSPQYKFNLSTDSLSAGTWEMHINLPDGETRIVRFSMRN